MSYAVEIIRETPTWRPLGAVVNPGRGVADLLVRLKIARWVGPQPQAAQPKGKRKK